MESHKIITFADIPKDMLQKIYEFGDIYDICAYKLVNKVSLQVTNRRSFESGILLGKLEIERDVCDNRIVMSKFYLKLLSFARFMPVFNKIYVLRPIKNDKLFFFSNININQIIKAVFTTWIYEAHIRNSFDVNIYFEDMCLTDNKSVNEKYLFEISDMIHTIMVQYTPLYVVNVNVSLKHVHLTILKE